MAVLPIPESNQIITMISPESLFFGLFFGLGGGLFLLIIFSAIIYWSYQRLGRIRLGAGGPGELDDEQRLLEEEQAAMEDLDPSQQEAYYRAKGFSFPIYLRIEYQTRFPPESINTDISLSQF